MTFTRFYRSCNVNGFVDVTIEPKIEAFLMCSSIFYNYDYIYIEHKRTGSTYLLCLIQVLRFTHAFITRQKIACTVKQLEKKKLEISIPISKIVENMQKTKKNIDNQWKWEKEIEIINVSYVREWWKVEGVGVKSE